MNKKYNYYNRFNHINVRLNIFSLLMIIAIITLFIFYCFFMINNNIKKVFNHNNQTNIIKISYTRERKKKKMQLRFNEIYKDKQVSTFIKSVKNIQEARQELINRELIDKEINPNGTYYLNQKAIM